MSRSASSLGAIRGGLCGAAVLCLAGAFQLAAIDVQQGSANLPPKLREAMATIDFERYDVRPQPVRAVSASVAGFASFAGDEGGEWVVDMDARADVPLKIEGSGMPLVPGSGNDLAGAAFGPQSVGAGEDYSLADVAAATDAFLAANQEMMRVAADGMMLDRSRSVGVGRSNRSWLVRYQSVVRAPDGEPIPVRGAYVFLRISHGNLIQFGNQLAVEPQGMDFEGLISGQEAMDRALDLFDRPAAASVAAAAVDMGQADQSLEIVPMNLDDGGLGHRLVRSVQVTMPELSIELWLDAHTGELVYAIDRMLTVDARVSGGIYAISNDEPEVVRGLPFLRVDNGGVKTADRAGVYDYAPPGSAATASLRGDFVSISDGCGASSLTSSAGAGGDLEFGSSGGTDCATPGVGGAGNTHAARTQYFHLNRVKDKARGFLNVPTVTTPWLEASLTANVNINNACNAFWNGSTVNFYRSGTVGSSTCANTGENAAVALHEFGHGLDQRTNGSSPENGSGEAFGDTVAFLETHESCIGRNFRPGRPCSFGCDASCTGVRDVDVAPEVRPSTIEQAPAACRRPGLACPYLTPGGFPYQGPMRYEGHCESLIASGAVWDMIEGFRARYGEGAGWALGDRIWYESLFQTGSAYRVVAGGQCNPAATVDGCGAENWYTVFLSLDDDNGNLADGTPNADLIWSAFDAHGIACGGTAPPVSSTCPALAAPALTVGAGAGQNDLSWTPVAGAASYRIFRSDFGCDRGAAAVAEVGAPATTFADTVIDGVTTYFYAVQAIGANDVCVSRFSNCADTGGVSLVLAPPALTIEEGSSGNLTATVTASGAGVPGVAVSFQSSDPAIATVTQTALTDAAGQARATVQGVARGRRADRGQRAGRQRHVGGDRRGAADADRSAGLVGGPHSRGAGLALAQGAARGRVGRPWQDPTPSGLELCGCDGDGSRSPCGRGPRGPCRASGWRRSFASG